jgi:hypothetical protein
MAFETRIENAYQFWMLFEMLCKGQRIARGLLNAEKKRAQAADEEIGLKASKRCAEANLCLFHLLPTGAGLTGG